MSHDNLATMTQAKWDALTIPERKLLRDNSNLSDQLCGLEGWRVEVIRENGDKALFWVGKSTGWRPVHLEISRRNCFGGISADKHYRSVKALYQR